MDKSVSLPFLGGAQKYVDLGDGTHALAVSSSAGSDSTGAGLPAGFENYAETPTYTDGNVTTLTRTGPGGSYAQTLTWDGDVWMGSSEWVKL